MRNLIRKAVNSVRAGAKVTREAAAEYVAPDLRFVPSWGRPDVNAPVVPAREVRPEWMKKQYSNPPLKIARCPGMWDYLQGGYIIPAWCDIHIKANKYGVSVRMEGANGPQGEQHKAVEMDFALIDGLAPINRDTVKPVVLKIPVPWSLFGLAGISAHIMPPTMHANFLDKLFVYPGTVDYDNKFHTINFIFSPLEECEFTIWAGEPLLHVIPFKRMECVAEVSPPTERESVERQFQFISRRPNYYRRAFHTMKKYTMILKDDK